MRVLLRVLISFFLMANGSNGSLSNPLRECTIPEGRYRIRYATTRQYWASRVWSQPVFLRRTYQLHFNVTHVANKSNTFVLQNVGGVGFGLNQHNGHYVAESIDRVFRRTHFTPRRSEAMELIALCDIPSLRNNSIQAALRLGLSDEYVEMWDTSQQIHFMALELNQVQDIWRFEPL